MRKYNTLIIDDEISAIRNVKNHLKIFPQFNVIGEAGNLADATEIIKTFKPDVVFLDIHLRNENGFDLFDHVNNAFITIFITAYDEYALRAFEVNAYNYLLKPIDTPKFNATINRILNDSNVIKSNITSLNYDDIIFIPCKDQLKIVKVADIELIQANDYYSNILLLHKNKILTDYSLKKWEEKLPGKKFLRIHRSTIINIDFVKSISKGFNGSYNVTLQNNPGKYNISRTYFSKIRKTFSL